MATITVAPGLRLWTLTLENGETRYVAASSLHAAIGGILASPVVHAARGAPEDGTAPPPVVNTLTPPSARLGDPDFTLHVGGSGFRAGDAILWNGAPEPTTFVSETELTTGVNMATAETAGPIPVGVQTLTGKVSNTVPFDLQAASVPPE